jgi:hypothetical protein
VGIERAPPLVEARRRRQALINSGRDQRREPPHRLIYDDERRPERVSIERRVQLFPQRHGGLSHRIGRCVHCRNVLKCASIASLINGQQRLLVELAHDFETPDRGLRGRRLVRCIRVIQTPKRVVEGVLCIIIILREQLLELCQNLRGASYSLETVRNGSKFEKETTHFIVRWTRVV